MGLQASRRPWGDMFLKSGAQPAALGLPGRSRWPRRCHCQHPLPARGGGFGLRQMLLFRGAPLPGLLPLVPQLQLVRAHRPPSIHPPEGPALCPPGPTQPPGPGASAPRAELAQAVSGPAWLRGCGVPRPFLPLCSPNLNTLLSPFPAAHRPSLLVAFSTLLCAPRLSLPLATHRPPQLPPSWQGSDSRWILGGEEG